MQIEYVDVDTLIYSKWNPIIRIAEIEYLTASIAREGFWEYEPILVGSDNIIADGHRRCAAAKAVGLKKVPIMRTGKPAQETWIKKDSLRKRIDGIQWVQAVSEGLDISSAPEVKSTMFKNIKLLQELGEEYVKYCAEKGVSATAMQSVNVVCKYVGKHDIEFRRQVLKWIIDTGCIRVVIYAVRDNLSVKEMLKAINSNKPITHRYGVAV